MHSVILLSRARTRVWREHVGMSVGGWKERKFRRRKDGLSVELVCQVSQAAGSVRLARDQFGRGRVLCHQQMPNSQKVRPPSCFHCSALPCSTVSTVFCCFLRHRFLEIAILGFGVWSGGELGKIIALARCCCWPGRATSHAQHSDCGGRPRAWPGLAPSAPHQHCQIAGPVPLLRPIRAPARAQLNSIRGWRGVTEARAPSGNRIAQKPADEVGG